MVTERPCQSFRKDKCLTTFNSQRMKIIWEECEKSRFEAIVIKI